MRKSILLFAVFITLAVLFNSCGGGSDDAPEVSSNDPSWKLGDNNYTPGTSSSNTSDIGVVVVSTTGTDTSMGAFAGSGLTISHTLQGAGTYLVVEDATELATVISADANAKVMTVMCTIGTQITPLAASSYEPQSGGTSAVAVDANGKYHITISGITMNKSLDLGTGVSNAPTSTTFSMENVFDFSN